MLIHRHRHTSETVVCLRGKMLEQFYDELERTYNDKIELSLGESVADVNVPAGQWYSARG